jgi:hypothetical protein
MTVYDKIDICFPYPDTWTIREEETQEWPRSVIAESPSGAFWGLHVYPGQEDCLLLVEEAIDAMRAEYDSLECMPPAASAMLEQMVEGEIVGEDMTFYCLDFLVHARVRCFQWRGRTYLTLSQAEDREFEQLADVFEAMAVGLLRELAEK